MSNTLLRALVFGGFIVVYLGIVGQWYGRTLRWVFHTQDLRMRTWQERLPLIIEGVMVGLVLSLPVIFAVVFYFITAP